MQSFVRALELWIPDEAGTSLEFAGGIYNDDLEEFREISELALFAYDIGLPGKAWAAGHPIILTNFADSYFRRADEARLFGLTCAVAIPVFAGANIKSVVGLLCGSDTDENVGAIELWHNNAELSHEMTLVDGYYGAAKDFEFNSRHTKFPRGYGLPGRAWKAGAPVLIKDIGEARQFLRAEDAAKSGMNFGLAIPYANSGPETWVISFLSASRTPIARRFEIWHPGADGGTLAFHSGYCSSGADLDAIFSGKTIRKGEGALGQALASNSPVIAADVTREASIAARAAAKAGLRQTVVMPVLSGNQLQAVIAWYP
jgi:putative methionine-R-sulfoxide reductase with GAF domain